MKRNNRMWGKQLGAWLLAFAMVLGLITVPAGEVQAATVTVTDATNTSKDVYVAFELDSTNSTSTYNQYAVKVYNNTTGTICDWEVTVQFAGDPGWNAGWNGVSYDSSAKKITIQTYGESSWNNATIYSGQTAGGAGFQVKAGALDNATVTLTYGTGESTDGPATGSSSGGSSSSGGETFDGSNIGSIDTSLDYNFAKLLQYSLYFYDANMCGDQVSETSLYSKDLYNGWRGDCHVNDSFTYNGKTYSAVGGYHDAGDHVKFGLPMSQAMTTLGLSYYEFGDAFDELGQTNHLKTIVDYYCTYVKSCTVLNDSGNQAVAFCYQVGNGDADHASWVAPEVEDENATKRTDTLVATSSNPATDIVSGTVAALALNYMNFGKEEDLKYAKALFAFAKNNNKAVADYAGSFYHSGYGEWQDEYCLAAALLYKITGDTTYATEYTSNDNNNGNIEKPYGWENAYQAAVFYAPSSSSNKSAHTSTIQNWFNSIANANASQYYCGDSWGSARVNCNVQFMMLLNDKLQGTNTYGSWCRYQMSTILGNNSTGKNLVCGYNTKSPTKPHHRAASGYSGWTDFNNNATQKYTLYGALCGGPTSSDFSTYNDAVNDAVSNEVAMDYNAGLVGSAAALYLLYKDSTDAGFTNQTINADFYGGSNFTLAGGSSTVAVTSVTLDETTLNLKKNATTTLNATVLPSNATNKKVTWSSSNTSVATVDDTGKVVAVASGTAVITVTTTDGSKVAACTVTVTNPVIAFTLGKTSISLEKGKTETLTYTVTPTDADSYKVTWKSSNSNIASVDSSSGMVTAVSKGTATITATLTRTADNTTIEKTCTVNVTVPMTGVALDQSALDLNKGNTATLKVSSEPSDANLGTVTWKTSNSNVATVVSSGNGTATVTAVKSGTATITATCDGYSQSCTVTVTTLLDTVALSQTAVELEKGGTKELVCTIVPADADIESISWSSSDKGIATISGDTAFTSGKAAAIVTAVEKSDSKATITVTVTPKKGNPITTTCEVGVVGKKVTGIVLDKTDLSMLVDDKEALNATITPADADNKTVTWTSSNASVAAVDASGNVTAVGEGSATITAVAGDNFTATCKVTVAKRTQSAPGNVNLLVADRTSNTLKIGVGTISRPAEGSGVEEYSIDGGKTWNTSGSFEGLSPFTKYEVCVRAAGNAKYKPSDIATNKLTAYTLASDPYTIDVSRLSGEEAEEYVDALRVSAASDPTVSYSNNVLTLNVAFSDYTITGDNGDITMVGANGITDIYLDNATVDKINVSNSDVTLNVKGTSTVGEILSTSDNAIAIVGSGTLNATQIEVGGDLSISDTTVKVDATETNCPAISAGSVTIKNSSVEVNVNADSEQYPITSDKIILVGDNNISSANGTDNIYSSTPKDENGNVVASYKVLFLDEDKETEIDSVTAFAGSQIVLPAVAEERGYALTWKEDTSGTLYQPKSTYTVHSDVTFTVNREKVLVNRIILDSTAETIEVGDGVALVETVEPENAYDTSVIWSSSNTSIATVDQNGEVTGVAPGTAIIMVKTKDGSGVYASCKVTVVEGEPAEVDVEKIKITGETKKVAPGKKLKLTATVYPANATNQTVKWKVNNKKYATVNSKGVVTTKKAGKGKKVTVTAYSVEDNSVKATYKISIMKNPVKKIKLSAKTKTIKRGKSVTIKARFTPSKGISKELTWTSSNKKIATVNSKGKVTGKKKGTVKITAKAKDGSGKKATIKIKVK